MEDFKAKQVPDSSLDSATRNRLAVAQTEPVVPVSSGIVTEEAGFWSKNKWFMLLLLAGLLALGIVVYFAFSKPTGTAQPKVNLQLVVPESVPSSTESIVKAVIENNDSRTITGGELELVYPNGVVFSSSNPNATNLSGTLFSIPDLPPGANISVFIKLHFEGGVGDVRKLLATYNFSLSGISARFNTTAEGSVLLATAGMSVDISGPVTVSNGQPISYTFHYVNASEQSFDKVRLELNAPVTFQLSESSPKPSQGQTLWDLGKLDPGASGDIVVSGAFVQAALGASVSMSVRLLVPDSLGSYYTQTTGQFTTTVATQPLVVAQTSDTPILKPGDTAQYRIEYGNGANVAARGVKVIMTLDSQTVDLATIQAEGASVVGNTITWSAASKPDLEVLNPNESGSLSMSVRVKDPPVKDRSVNPDVVTNVKIKSDEYDVFLPGNKLQLKIATQFSLETRVELVDGARPPRVGQATRYKVVVALKNSTSDVTGSVATMFIATGGSSFEVNSINSGEAKAVTFDSSTGKLTWRVDNVRAHTGDFSPSRNLEFIVRAVPSLSGVGLPISLVKNLQFTGVDSSTGQPISRSVQLVSSADSSLGADGIVVK